LEEKYTQIKTAIYRPKTYWHDLKNDLSAAAGKTKITAFYSKSCMSSDSTNKRPVLDVPVFSLIREH